jgi:hypothetical protein
MTTPKQKCRDEKTSAALPPLSQIEKLEFRNEKKEKANSTSNLLRGGLHWKMRDE